MEKCKTLNRNISRHDVYLLLYIIYHFLCKKKKETNSKTQSQIINDLFSIINLEIINFSFFFCKY